MNKITLGAIALTLVFAFGATDASAYSFQRNLTLGSTGSDVTALQQMLVSKGYLTMPSGVAYGYFGNLTKSAVARLQLANGIAPAVGYFGPITMAKVNAWTDTVVTPNPPVAEGELKGGDGDFRNFEVLGSPSNKDVEEGGKEKVFAFEFDADDSDLMIERLDLRVTGNGNTEKPWRFIESINLYNGDKKITTVNADEKSDWDEQDNDEYEITFGDLDEIVREGKTAKFYVEVVASDSIDDSDLPLEFDIFIPDNGLRAVNAEGINVYEGNDSDMKSFTIETPSEGQLSISVDDNDNEDKQVEVEENDETEEVVLYTAEIESDEGDNSIEEITVSLATTTGTTARLSDMINTLYLFVDGEEVASESVNGGASESVTFDDLEIEVGDNDSLDIEIRADINEQEDNFANGSGVKVTSLSVDFVDSLDDDYTETSSVAGGDITFSTDALGVSIVNTPSAVSPVANDESKRRFYVEFKITAPDSDAIYIAKGATTSTSVASGKGAQFMVVDGNGNEVSATSTEALLAKVSGGSETGGYYKISEGQTATFKLDVIVENTGAASARTLGIQLLGINYKVGAAAVADSVFDSGIDEDFRSDTAYLLTANTSN